MGILMIKGSLCCMCGDTFSSELGPVLGKAQTQVFHIVKLTWVPKGTNGGISFFGTLVSFFAGLFVGLGYYLTLKICLYLGDITTSKLIFNKNYIFKSLYSTKICL